MDVAQTVFQARIPVRVALVSADLVDAELPDVSAHHREASRPHMALVRRVAYAPELLSSARSHYPAAFGRAAEMGLAPFLEDDRCALPWHYPLGHLFDEACAAGSRPALPWRLSVRFRRLPPPGVLPVPGPADSTAGAASGAHHYAMLKQADYVRNGMMRDMPRLGKGEQARLWEALLAGDWTGHASVFHAVVRAEDAADFLAWRSVPVRVYRIDSAGRRTVLQMPVPAGTPDVAALKTLHGIPGANRLLTHGIVVPEDLSLHDCVRSLLYPDGFLHLIALP